MFILKLCMYVCTQLCIDVWTVNYQAYIIFHALLTRCSVHSIILMFLFITRPLHVLYICTPSILNYKMF